MRHKAGDPQADLVARRSHTRYAPSLLTGIHSTGKNVCIKHLVCNDSETSRREYNVQVDERPLREVYLRPFEMVVAETNPSSIMTAYNSIVR